ncbi:hypothetical protein, partial [Globicatella sulfidifaciens]
LYSAFETNKEFVVRFRNRTIGTLERWYVNALGDEFQFTLAGSSWQTIKIDYDRSILYVDEATHSVPPNWMSDSSFFSHELSQEVLTILTSEENYNFLNPAELSVLSIYREELEMTGLKMNTMLIDGRKDGFLIITYAGNRVNYTIANAIQTQFNYFDITSLTWKGFKLKCEDRDLLPALEKVIDAIKLITKKEFYNDENKNALIELVPDISFSKYQKYLPTHMRKEQSAEYVYDIDTTLSYLGDVEILGYKDLI